MKTIKGKPLAQVGKKARGKGARSQKRWKLMILQKMR